MAAVTDWKDSGYVSVWRDSCPIEGAALMAEGVDFVVIKELLGHAHIGVTATVYPQRPSLPPRDAIDLLGHALESLAESDEGNDRRSVRSRSLTLPSTTAVRRH
ncbi:MULTISPECIES: hypothetical protein [unclassified Streptomyces]|uniref:hypothetical protein n=1 Tax=unclassified Streptomyces TaxID=2593676 RepID=UPI002E2BC8E7|nr:hypothetical protein [Streptomyces sp. NBC_00223]